MLGLSPDNTAIDRARAMGFRDQLKQAHGMGNDLKGGGFYSDAEKKVSESTTGNRELPGTSVAITPATSDFFAERASAGSPLLMDDSTTPIRSQGLSHEEYAANPAGFQPLPELIDAQKAQRTYGEGARSVPLVSRWESLGQFPVRDSASTTQINQNVLDAFEDLGFDAVKLDNYSAVPGYGPHSFLQVKSPEQLRSPFAAFDPARKDSKNILASAGLMAAGAGAAAYGMTPEDAGAGKLPWKADAKAQLLSQIFEGLRAGKVQPQVFEDLAGLNGGFKLPEYLMMGGDLRHVFERRMMDNGWSADRVVAALDTLFGSEDARGVPNLIGRKASEAVWSPGKPRGVYAPAIPGPDGEVRIYSLMDPENKRILRGIGKLEEGSSGGRMSPPFTQTADFPSSESVTQRHRAKLSAVDEPSADKDQIMPDTNTVKKIIGLGLLGGTGLAAYGAAAPDDANAMSYIGPKGLAGIMGADAARSLPAAAEHRLATEAEGEALRQANHEWAKDAGNKKVAHLQPEAGRHVDLVAGLCREHPSHQPGPAQPCP